MEPDCREDERQWVLLTDVSETAIPPGEEVKFGEGVQLLLANLVEDMFGDELDVSYVQFDNNAVTRVGLEDDDSPTTADAWKTYLTTTVTNGGNQPNSDASDALDTALEEFEDHPCAACKRTVVIVAATVPEDLPSAEVCAKKQEMDAQGADVVLVLVAAPGSQTRQDLLDAYACLVDDVAKDVFYADDLVAAGEDQGLAEEVAERTCSGARALAPPRPLWPASGPPGPGRAQPWC